MNDSTEVNILLEKFSLLDKMYQAFRVVDPLDKKVLEHVENKILEKDMSCYEFWKRQEICENCISMRAYNEDDTFVKIEYKQESIYMVTAVPVVINGRKLIVEMMKNITDSIYAEESPNDNSIQIYSLIKNINRVAVTDALTGIYNRRYINERLPVELVKASINKNPLSIIFTDLDNFKLINDTYGHLTGDSILVQFAKELQNCIRKDKDWLARYGGEEFLICLLDTDYTTAINIADRMRRNIETKNFIVQNTQIKVTASFGVYTLEDYTGCITIDDVIAQADTKLLMSKNAGRNKVV